MGALLMAYTILRVPYCKYSLMGPILRIKASLVEVRPPGVYPKRGSASDRSGLHRSAGAGFRSVAGSGRVIYICLGVSENREPKYSTLNSRILIIRTPE